jgi:hypothetical protein
LGGCGFPFLRRPRKRPQIVATATREARRTTKRKTTPNHDLELEGILCSGRELALLNLLTANDVDIGIITEAEIPAISHGDFNIEEYHSYLPHQSNLLKAAKYRV